MSLKLPSLKTALSQAGPQGAKSQSKSFASSLAEPAVQAAQSVQQASEIASDNLAGADLIDGVFDGIWARVYPWIESIGAVGVFVLTIVLAAIVRNPRLLLL